jgi:hypothetical protein
MTDNNRNHPRIRLDSRVFIELTSADLANGEPAEIVSCKLLDVSQSGLQVKLETELPVGAILHIGAELPGTDDTFYMAGEVKWCRPGNDPAADWLVGFQLLNAHDSDIEGWRQLLEHV